MPAATTGSEGMSKALYAGCDHREQRHGLCVTMGSRLREHKLATQIADERVGCPGGLSNPAAYEGFPSMSGGSSSSFSRRNLRRERREDGPEAPGPDPDLTDGWLTEYTYEVRRIPVDLSGRDSPFWLYERDSPVERKAGRLGPHPPFDGIRGLPEYGGAPSRCLSRRNLRREMHGIDADSRLALPFLSEVRPDTCGLKGGEIFLLNIKEANLNY